MDKKTKKKAKQKIPNDIPIFWVNVVESLC